MKRNVVKFELFDGMKLQGRLNIKSTEPEAALLQNHVFSLSLIKHCEISDSRPRH